MRWLIFKVWARLIKGSYWSCLVLSCLDFLWASFTQFFTLHFQGVFEHLFYLLHPFSHVPNIFLSSHPLSPDLIS